jgi:cell division septum initiation protein DivIVA
MLRGRAPKSVVFSENRAADLPQYPGQLATTFGTAPIFRSVIHGYDRIQVDSYVAWAEDELLTQRRAIREVVGQFREAVGELERSRSVPVRSAEAQQLLDVTGHAQRLLVAAADEASDLLSTAAAEADRVVTEAHTEARARLERVRLLRERVGSWCDTERQRIEADRAAARELVAAAHVEAARLVEEGRRQRAEEDRAAEEARARAAEEASARLAAVTRQVDGLQGQWRDLLARLRSTDGLVARALAMLDRDPVVPAAPPPPTGPPVQQLPRSA